MADGSSRNCDYHEIGWIHTSPYATRHRLRFVDPAHEFNLIGEKHQPKQYSVQL